MVEVDLKALLDPRTLVGGGLKLVERFGDEAYFAAVCIRSGMVGPELPHKLAQMLLAFERHGLLAGAVTIGAIRHGDRVVIRDERGDVTYKELDERTNALANAWRDEGLAPGDGVAILVRNHRGFLESVFAAAKLRRQDHPAQHILRRPPDPRGGRARGHRPARLRRRVRRGPRGRRSAPWPLARLGRGRCPAPREAGDSLESLIADGNTAPPPRAGRAPKIVILTSGTTGTPKGAPRDEPKSLGIIGGLLSKVPFHARETTELPVPMFHALGFASMALGLALGSTLVVRRHFDPEATLDSLQENEATALVVVPVMLQRMLELPDNEVAARDTSHLKIIFVVRLGPERRPGQAVDEGVRPGRLQHVRLHRDRLRDDRHARGPGRRARQCRQGGARRRWSRSSTTTARR